MFNSLGKSAHNKYKALQIYNQQVKKLDMAPQDIQDVIKLEAKLQSIGHVDFVRNRSPAQLKMLRTNSIQNFIPWRAVWNGSSVSTPNHLVFDTSQPTSPGTSFNDLLAKDNSNINKLVEIVIRWYSHEIEFHPDIKKNSVQLKEEH